MTYTWYVQNQDPGTIQFCVQQSGGYSNCVSIPGNSTQAFVIPDMDVQIYGTPTGYYVYYSNVGVKTGVKSLPPSGSTITVPPYQGCIPLLTQGQGYPPLIPCNSPLIYIKSESTPSMFIENFGADTAGFSYGYGIAGSQLAIATGPNWEYYRQYPRAQVYLIGNWRVTSSGDYYDEDSGKTYCGCPGKSVYVIPLSALPGPSTTTTSTGTSTGGSTGTSTGGSTGTSTGTQTPTTGTLNVANQCSTGVVVQAGGKTAYAPPYHAISMEVPIPTTYTLISQGQTVGQGTVSKSGEYVSPQFCPSVSPTPSPTPTPSPSGGTTQTTTTQTTSTTPSQVPWGVLLALVILGALALSS